MRFYKTKSAYKANFFTNSQRTFFYQRLNIYMFNEQQNLLQLDNADILYQ